MADARGAAAAAVTVALAACGSAVGSEHGINVPAVIATVPLSFLPLVGTVRRQVRGCESESPSP